MKLTAEGIALIKSYEGLRLTTYLCPAGKPTIGYGHTGSDVTIRVTITNTHADKLFESDINRFAIGVKSLLKKKLNDAQFSALVSFAYNCGLGALANSTLLKCVNDGKLASAALEFAKWNRGGGKVLPGLVKRRGAEAKLFMRGVPV